MRELLPIGSGLIYLSKYLGSIAEVRDEGMGQMEGNRMEGFQR